MNMHLEMIFDVNVLVHSLGIHRLPTARYSNYNYTEHKATRDHINGLIPSAPLAITITGPYLGPARADAVSLIAGEKG